MILLWISVSVLAMNVAVLVLAARRASRDLRYHERYTDYRLDMHSHQIDRLRDAVEKIDRLSSRHQWN